ncbi:acyl-CoA-binding domain-containing protein 5-B [Hoplias malabaricus]|uniref:acyl-CoA-binding domain-containing protein 5-B n=1 Tax=Hoplias malabaricus TaxID=27720 RepID=UPI003462D17C
MDNNKPVHERQFEAAVKVIRNLPEDGTLEPSDDLLVMLYSYYKQATVGPCNTIKPNGWDSIGKAKWEAWKALGDMTKEQAMKEYVQEIQLILETVPVTEEVAELLDELEPFYEVVDGDEENDAVTKLAILAKGTSSVASIFLIQVLLISKLFTGQAKISDEGLENEEDEASIHFVEDGDNNGDRGEDVNWLALVKKVERGFPLVCNGNTDMHSVSSLTSSTHSSLNTEEDEEELACSGENIVDSPDLFSCTDHIKDDASGQKLQSGVVDLDLYSDSAENSTVGEGSGAPMVQLARSRQIRAKRLEEQDGNQQESTLANPVTRGRGRDLPGNRGVCNHGMNSQIVAALSRLKNDMQSVLQRLQTLETQVESFPPECELHSAPEKKRFHWWPLDISPVTVVMALLWPFAVHLFVQMYLLKKRRRIK